MDLHVKLQEAIDAYNDLINEEHEAEEALLCIREKRTLQLGKVQAIKSLVDESLKEASLNASSNGSEKVSEPENAK